MAHGHHHVHGGANRRRLAIALALALSYMTAELIGGWLTGSLALLADAGHMASDAGALALALFASWATTRPSGPRLTYGRARLEILAALAQGVALIAVALLVGVEAIDRLGSPGEVSGLGMLVIATGGLIVNLFGLRILEAGRHESLNVRGAWLHVASDALASVGAIVAGALVWAFGWMWADPVASLVIAAIVALSAVSLLRDAVDVLMEAAPRDVDVEQVRSALLELEHVSGVHDLHVWSVADGQVSLSCHLVVPEDGRCTPLLSDAYSVLGGRFGINHATIQVEPQEFADQTPIAVCTGHALAREQSA